MFRSLNKKNYINIFSANLDLVSLEIKKYEPIIIKKVRLTEYSREYDNNPINDQNITGSHLV